jgi:hypothetical protein
MVSQIDYAHLSAGVHFGVFDDAERDVLRQGGAAQAQFCRGRVKVR